MSINNKTKKLVFTVSDMTLHWLTLIAGLTSFTERETELLALLINYQTELQNKQLSKQLVSELLLSSESRKRYCESMQISRFNLTNLLSSLKKKKALLYEGDLLTIQPMLIPASEIHIRYERGTQVK